MPLTEFQAETETLYRLRSKIWPRCPFQQLGLTKALDIRSLLG